MEEHLVKTNHLPLACLGINGKIGMQHLSGLDIPSLNLPSGNRSREVVIASLDSEVGERNLPVIPGGDSWTA